MDKIKIKPPGAPTQAAKERLFHLIQELGIEVTKLAIIPDGFLAIPLTEKDGKNLIKISTVDKLKEQQYTVVTPMTVNARKTLIVRNNDKYVTNKSKETLIQEFNQRNGGIMALDMIVIPRYNLIKIKFDTVEKAEWIKKNGIKFELVSVGTDQIEHEEFIQITQCFNCYSYDHPTHKCTYGRKLPWCSECGSRNHHYRECDNPNTKHCLNCQGPHRTMANTCLMRKQAIAKQRKQNKENEITKHNKPLHEVAKIAARAVTAEATTTWRDIAARPSPSSTHSTPPQIFLHIPHHISTTYATIISIAHQLSLINPDKNFREIVHSLCTEHNLEPFDIGHANTPTPNWGKLQIFNPSQPSPNPPTNPTYNPQPPHHPSTAPPPTRPALLATPALLPNQHCHPHTFAHHHRPPFIQPNHQPRLHLSQPFTSQPRHLLPTSATQTQQAPHAAPIRNLNLAQNTTQQNTPPITTPPALSSTALLSNTTFPNLDTPSHHDPLHRPIDTHIPSNFPSTSTLPKDKPNPNLPIPNLKPTTTHDRPQTPKRQRETDTETDATSFLSPARRQKSTPRHTLKTTKQLYPNMAFTNDKDEETDDTDMDTQTISPNQRQPPPGIHPLTNTTIQHAHTPTYPTPTDPPHNTPTTPATQTSEPQHTPFIPTNYSTPASFFFPSTSTTTTHPFPTCTTSTTTAVTSTATMYTETDTAHYTLVATAQDIISSPIPSPTPSPSLPTSPSATLVIATAPHSQPPTTSTHSSPRPVLSSTSSTTTLTPLPDPAHATQPLSATAPLSPSLTTNRDNADNDPNANEMTDIRRSKNSESYTFAKNKTPIATPRPKRDTKQWTGRSPAQSRLDYDQVTPRRDIRHDPFTTPNPPSRTHFLPPQPNKTPSHAVPKKQKPRTPSVSSSGYEHTTEQQQSQIASPKTRGPVQHSPQHHHPSSSNPRTPHHQRHQPQRAPPHTPASEARPPQSADAHALTYPLRPMKEGKNN